MKSLVNYQEIEKAYNRISNYATKTPLLSSDLLNKEFSSNIFIKAENLQKIGAFKFRGAMNSILKLDNDKKNEAQKIFEKINNKMGYLWI